MTETPTGRIVAAGAAGLLTLVLTLAPSALLVAIIALGALGEAEFARLGPTAILLFVVVATFAGYLVHRGLEQVSAKPRTRRPADVWIAFVVFLTILLVGVILIPVVVVFITVDSDHGLSDRELLVSVLWLAGHAGLVAIAYLTARALFRVDRPDPLDSD